MGVDDGLFQLPDGIVDPAARTVIADQEQRGLEIQSRGEYPADHEVIEVAVSDTNGAALPDHVPDAHRIG
jgi:hypothetical protein